MNIKNLFKEDDAVSPVIGVILMVAITVILAAVIASFVLGLGDQADEVQPNSNFEFDYEVSDTNNNNLTISLTDGDSINAGDLYLRGEIGSASVDIDWTSSNGLLDTNFDNSPPISDGPSSSTEQAATVGGFSGDELQAGQGIEFYGTGSFDSYDLDVVWDTGDDSATLASDDNEA